MFHQFCCLLIKSCCTTFCRELRRQNDWCHYQIWNECKINHHSVITHDKAVFISKRCVPFANWCNLFDSVDDKFITTTIVTRYRKFRDENFAKLPELLGKHYDFITFMHTCWLLNLIYLCMYIPTFYRKKRLRKKDNCFDFPKTISWTLTRNLRSPHAKWLLKRLVYTLKQ